MSHEEARLAQALHDLKNKDAAVKMTEQLIRMQDDPQRTTRLEAVLETRLKEARIARERLEALLREKK